MIETLTTGRMIPSRLIAHHQWYWPSGINENVDIKFSVYDVFLEYPLSGTLTKMVLGNAFATSRREEDV